MRKRLSQKKNMTDERYMALAVQEAWKGCGHVNPNPMVGCVVVKGGKIIARGFHRKYGAPHAERAALSLCSADTEGATLYVTLEPCCHYGKTPPCTDAIIESKVARVVFGSSDPNPLVAGKSRGVLEAAGIKVDGGVLKEECDALNEAFFYYITTGKPFIIVKYAMTADGKVATVTGKSKWITGEEARQRVHFDRHRYSALITGVGTVASDNPLLTCRFENFGGSEYPEVGKVAQPVRIVCDTRLRTPLYSNIVRTARHFNTIIATAETDTAKHAPYIEQGCEILTLQRGQGGVDIAQLVDELGKMGIDSAILESGPALTASFLEAGFANKAHVYIAPTIFGGSGKSPVAGRGAPTPADALRITGATMRQYGRDFLIEGNIEGFVPPAAESAANASEQDVSQLPQE